MDLEVRLSVRRKVSLTDHVRANTRKRCRQAASSISAVRGADSTQH
jgi:hypothetical protein